MDRRRFTGAATLTVAAAIRAAWLPPGAAASAARTTHVATPVAEERCLPALALSLGLGQTSVVERSAGRSLTVRFVAVDDDSRCPVSQGAVCVWEGQATVVVEVDLGSGAGPEVTRVDWRAGSVFHLVWGHQGMRLFVVAVDLSGDSATPREDLVLDLIVFPDWPGGEQSVGQARHS
jgi:hypothetical protein